MKIPFPNNLSRMLKFLVPESLFGRALLILVLPTLCVQLVATYVFYERHWDNVTKHMSNSLAGEIALLTHQRINGQIVDSAAEFRTITEQLMGIELHFEPRRGEITLDEGNSNGLLQGFELELRRRLGLPCSVTLSDDGDYIRIQVALPRETMTAIVSIKRLASSTTYIFISAMLGTALVLLVIATMFLRNQIRPIVRLAQAAERFGRGQDMPDFHPHGAREVRMAAKSFLAMRERLQRLITSRIEMLAGISHDLRTPLTRMRLGLAMLGDSKDIEDLKSDVVDMEKMIAEYLEFARGEGGEEAKPTELLAQLGALVESYRKHDADVQMQASLPVTLPLRPNAFRRCMSNLIDNALRYGRQCRITVPALAPGAKELTLLVDDDGPGIPKESRELVFQAFKRLDPSRNLQTGGVGLGLSIVQDIVHGHGGEVLLEDSPQGGLRVRVLLPL